MTQLFSVQGLTALVTGGASGIGRMCAQALVEGGAHVLIASRRAQACETAADEINQLGFPGRAVGLKGDVSTEEGIHALAAGVAERTQQLHVLINNAGKTWGAPLEQFPYAAWNSVMSINVVAPFTLMQRLLPLLEAGASAQRPARVVNIGSVAGQLLNNESIYSYGASKAAVHHLTRQLARELAPRHITLNVVAPGLFETRMTAHIVPNEAQRAARAREIPLGRLGQAEDIAGVVQFLCSRAGAYVTGAVLALDGGMSVELGVQRHPEME
jgi:NAD(P)-dependent dehydrogenase (short-subunit alcohol dehydrogenase family)